MPSPKPPALPWARWCSQTLKLVAPGEMRPTDALKALLHALRDDFGAHFAHLTLQPLADEQQQQLIEQRLTRGELADELLDYVRTRLPRDTETGTPLSTNPLMLSMVISTFEGMGCRALVGLRGSHWFSWLQLVWRLRRSGRRENGLARIDLFHRVYTAPR